MPSPCVAIIGAGMAGLTAALDLAAKQVRTIVIERQGSPGGKLHAVPLGEAWIDDGPTVFTMRAVFEELFEAAGARLEDHLSLQRADILARHAWSESERLDLFADRARTIDAIGEFAGAREAQRYLRFTRDAQRIFSTLDRPFIRAQHAGPLALVLRVGLGRLPDLINIRPFETLWRALGRYFRDPRLQQLFARYSTYCGSSPFEAPATMMLIAHVEQSGVWLVTRGMQRLAEVIAQLAQERGAEFRLGTEAEAVVVRKGRVSGVHLSSGEFVPVDAVIVNADVAAVASGRLGPEAARAVPAVLPARRSLSAITWALLAQTRGFPLLRHTVFFSPDYAAEFDQIFRQQRLPVWPTVYVCAQDRGACDAPPSGAAERLLCLVNAPPNGDAGGYDATEIEQCEHRTFTFLERCGLQIQRRPQDTRLTTPPEFERRFPGTGGGLYGQATHGWRASFTRPGARTRLKGLYLAGGSVHPGPGLPMTALSGRLAAARVLEDLTSHGWWRRGGTHGGISTP
ncbi:MAG: phytoene desaturase [Proteobacteria bacterium]|nr:phytoene desaturase [Pseudomonadota bacterium]